MSEIDTLLEQYQKYQKYEREKFMQASRDEQDIVIRGMARLCQRLAELWPTLSPDQMDRYMKII